MLEGCTPWPEDVAERYRADGYWRGETLIAAFDHWVERFGDREALVAGDERLSYAELGARSWEIAGRLWQAGLRPRDRVIVQLHNIPEFLDLTFALLRIGALPVFALPAHREHEIGHLVAFADAVAYAIPAQHGTFDYMALATELKDKQPTLEHLLAAGKPVPEGTVGISPAARAACDSAAREEIEALTHDPAEVALFLISGGTTGLPKLIPRTHDDYLYNVEMSARLCGCDCDSRYLVVLPVAHNFSLCAPGVLGVLGGGGTVVLSTSAKPQDVFALIERERVTFTSLVPALTIRWCESKLIDDHDLSSLRFVQVGGARLAPEAARRVGPRLGCTLQQVFGMAEGLVNFTRLDDPEEVIVETQGRPLSEADEILIVGSDDRPAAADEPGELLTRGPYTLRGYYRAEEQNRRAFNAEGYYRTGDVVRMHPSGNLLVEGRSKDLINRGGEKISAEEVENLVLSHPSVFNVAAVAMPDRVLGERTCVYVVLMEGVTLEFDELVAFLKGKGIARYKLPERLEVIDALPLTPVGKVAKQALREDIAAKLAAAEEAAPGP